MKYKLQDLIDIEHFQNLQEKLNQIYSFPASIIDNDGNILTATAWQDICTKFHRKNKECERECIKSDQYIIDHLSEANPAVSYRCPHGLVDNATPIIIDGVHYGNFFTGQFFLEEPNLEFFRAQAKKYGFPEESYIDAVKKVPIWTKEQLDNYLFFIKGLITVISESGLKTLKEIETRKTIEKSEERHRSILKTALDGFWIVNAEGRLLEVNDAYCKMSGYSENELLNMHIPDLEAVEDPQLVAEHMKKVISQGSDRFESKHYRKDGSVFDVELSIQFRPEEGGQCVCFIRDITERKRTEEALRESEEKFRFAMESTNDGLWDWDIAKNHVFYSAGWGGILGHEKLEPLYDTWASKIHPEDKQSVLESLEKHLMGYTEQWRMEHRLKASDGTWKWVLGRGTVKAWDDNGNSLRVVGTMTDISDQKHYEEALQKSEDRLRIAGMAAYDLIYEWEVASDNLVWFGDIDGFLGYEPGEVSRNINAWIDLIHPEDRVNLKNAVELHRTSTEAIRYEYRLKHKNGDYLYVQDHGLPLLDKGGLPYKWIGACADITGRKKAEEDLRKSEARYRDIAGAQFGIVWETDENFIVTHLSGRAKEILGYEPEEIIGQTPFFLIDSEDRERVNANLTQLSKKTEPIRNIEYWCRHKDSRRVRIRTSGVPFFNRNNRFSGYRGAHLDITETYWARRCQDYILQIHEMSRDSDEAISSALCEACAELTDSPMAFFGMVEPDGLAMIAHVWSPRALSECSISEKPQHFPIETAGIWAEPFRRREPYLCNNYQDLHEKKGLPEGHIPIARYMGVPVIQGDKVIAIAGAANRAGGYEERHIIRLRLVTSSIADFLSVRRKEKELIESEEKYRVLFNTFPLGITVSDQTGKIVEANDAAEQFLGISRAEHYKRHIDGAEWRIVRPDGTPMPSDEYASLRALKENRRIDNVEMGIAKPDGNISWINVSAAPLNLEKYGVVVTYGDITARKKAEEALQESEKRFRSYFELPLIGIAITSLDKKWVEVNQKLCDILGYSREEMTALTWTEITYPDDLDSDVGNFEDVLAGKTEGYSMEKRFIRKDRAILHANISVRCVRRIDGTPDYFVALVQDITERKQAEAVLRESEERFRNLFEDSVDAHVLYSGDQFTDCNQACLNMLGLSNKKQLLCLHPSDISPQYQEDGSPSRQKAEAMIALAFEKGNNRFEWLCKKVDGSELRLEILLNVIKIKGKDIIHGVWRDITMLKKLQEQVIKTQKMESIGNLAGGIAHDFNNILFPIIGMSEMLLEDLPPGSIERENAEEIFKAGKRGSELVKQILAFSRQSEHKLTPTHIQNIIKEVIKLSRASIPTYIEIDQEIQQDCGLVMADPSQIHQIGMNLITNAYHAVEEKGGKILIRLKQALIKDTVSLRINLSPGAYTVLSVSDTGHGMSEEIMGKIFDPYFTTKEQGKGTGLGLAVVYGIVKEHQGDIKVYSEIGKGSTFEIYLPLMKKDDRIESIHTPEAYRGGNERILLVDDEESVAKLEKMMLERMGYNVTCRLHSAEALEAFRASPFSFDLVLSDMSMPNIPGDELAKKIKSIRSDVPIIICTGFSERIHEDTIQQMGIDGLLMKPVIQSELAKTVRKILDESKNS